jgi:hypothetical protein
MTQTLTDIPHDSSPTFEATRLNGTEQRILHVPGFFDRFLALTDTSVGAHDGTES